MQGCGPLLVEEVFMTDVFRASVWVSTVLSPAGVLNDMLCKDFISTDLAADKQYLLYSK